MNRSLLPILAVIIVVGVISWSRYRPSDEGDTQDPALQPPRIEMPEKKPEETGRLAPVLGEAPGFELIDQDGETFSSDGLRERVYIINFMFTRCETICPTQCEVMLNLQTRLSKSLAPSDVQLLSITVDPEYDTPEKLKELAGRYGAQSSQWRFLTGDKDQIWQLSESLGMSVSENAEDESMPIVRESKFAIVDRAGQRRGLYDVFSEGGFVRLQQALDFVLPEIPASRLPEGIDSSPGITHLAQPPEIIRSAWIEERMQQEAEVLEQAKVFHDFEFQNVVDESGIDLKPLIVDEQRWRLQVNHYDHGNGVAIADVDADGRLDIYFVTQAADNRLYRNLGDGTFEDMTERAAVALADRIGVSASFADIDNDGDADLFVTTVRDGNVLFENDGTGAFTDISKQAGVDYVGHSSAAVFFDYDRDGLLDLFVTNVGKYSTDEEVSLRLDETSPVTSGEYKYFLGTKDAFAGHLKPELSEASILYRNVGDNRFEDVSESMGLDMRWAGAATPLDVNEDGWQDLYVLSMQGHDEYYENQEGKRFVPKGKEVFPRTSWGAMGVKSFDFDNDSKMDLFITDMHSDMSQDVGWEREYEKADMQWPPNFLQSTSGESIFGNSFFQNQGDGSFREVSDRIGAENYWPWGLSVGDLNADGYVDAFLASSMCFPYRYSMNSVFLNESGKRFVPSECALGIEPRPAERRIKPWFALDSEGADRDSSICRGREGKVVVWSALGSRSSAIFDYDEDGDLDIITHDFGSRPQVFRSRLGDVRDSVNHLKVELQGSQSNRDGLGARVTVVSGALQQSKVNDGQSGYLSQSRAPLYFGLGDAESVDRLEVRWPSGDTQVVDGPIEINRLMTIVEGE